MRPVAYILWLAVVVMAVVALVQAISGAQCEPLLAITLIVVGIAGGVTMTAPR